MDPSNVIMYCSGGGTFVGLLWVDDIIQISLALSVERTTSTDGHQHDMLQTLLISAVNQSKLAPSAQTYLCIGNRLMRPLGISLEGGTKIGQHLFLIGN